MAPSNHMITDSVVIEPMKSGEVAKNQVVSDYTHAVTVKNIKVNTQQGHDVSSGVESDGEPSTACEGSSSGSFSSVSSAQASAERPQESLVMGAGFEHDHLPCCFSTLRDADAEALLPDCLATLRKRTEELMMGDSADKRVQSKEEESVLMSSSELCELTFQPGAGPRGMGLLTATVRPGTIDAESVLPVLDILCAWTCNGALQGDFVAIFDISEMSMPSIFGLPSLVAVFEKHADQLTAFRDFQQGFAVIRGNSIFFNTFVDTLVSVSKAETNPIFAPDQTESLNLLMEHFSNNC